MGIWIWVILAVVVIVIGLALLFGRNRDGGKDPVVRDTGSPEVPGSAAPAAAEHTTGEAADTDGAGQPELNFAFAGVEGAETFGPAVLAAGSTVTFDGTDYLVAGTGALKEGDFIWYEHLLQGGDSPHWLSVENLDGSIRLGWWSNRAEITADETAEQHEVDGRTYTRLAEGDAVFAVSGLSGAVTKGDYRYVDYATDDSEHLLRIETWGEGAEPGASTGFFIGYEDLAVHPPEKQR